MIWMLLAMLVLGLGSQHVFVHASALQYREKQRMQAKLIASYNDALTSFYNASPGSFKTYPTELKQLLLDVRHLQVKRHLRKLYEDPLQPGVPADRAWGVFRDARGGISKVYAVDHARSIDRIKGSNE